MKKCKVISKGTSGIRNCGNIFPIVSISFPLCQNVSIVSKLRPGAGKSFVSRVRIFTSI